MEGTKLDLSALEPKLLAAVRKVAERVRAAGGGALSVGGSVRDLLLGGLAVKDVDLEVFGLSADRLQQVVGAAFGYDACGLSFGVLKGQHYDIDSALPRRAAARRARFMRPGKRTAAALLQTWQIAGRHPAAVRPSSTAV